MLKFAGSPFRVPDHVYVHGFITVSGEKMSKSRGTGISPLRYLEIGMNAEWLRYYIAAKLNGNVEDIDFNPDDFTLRVNSDLVGKYVNIASRAAAFINRQFGGQLRYAGDMSELRRSAQELAASVGAAYEAREYGRALRECMAFADGINQYFDGIFRTSARARCSGSRCSRCCWRRCCRSWQSARPRSSSAWMTPSPGRMRWCCPRRSIPTST
jgi:methionyl-tRNA synthetase